MSDNSILQKVQQVEFEALKAFALFCVENNITFYLRGGSVLGAVKYGGFIPWDDDLDVAVPRVDYEKLIQLSDGHVLEGKFIINSYKYNSDLHCYFPRMVLTEEERIRRGLPKNTKLGLHIMDIFPLDGAPKTWIARKIYFGRVYLLRALASLGTIYEGEMVNMHTSTQQLVIDILRFCGVDKKIKQRDVYEKLDKLYRSYNLTGSKYAGTITASLFSKEIFPIKVWGNGKLVTFNGLNVRVPEEYDSYLKQLYGHNYLHEEPDDAHKKSHLG